MAKIFNIATKKQIIYQKDEWAVIGVHLETKIAAGMALNEAINQLMLEGFDINRIKAYLKRIGEKDGTRLEDAAELYTPEENEIIRKWILCAPYPARGSSEKGELFYRVAELVLFPVRTSLPQWATIYHGKVETSRIHQLKAIRKRDGLLNPSFLFQINWADSGPGISWPESYYLTFLPVYNIFVLTASQESDEVHGYTDLALTYIDPQEGAYIPYKPVLLAIKNWWVDQKDNTFQGPWESLWNTGIYSPYEVTALRDKIWKDWSY